MNLSRTTLSTKEIKQLIYLHVTKMFDKLFELLHEYDQWSNQFMGRTSERLWKECRGPAGCAV